MDAPDKLHCMHRLNGDYSCSTTPFGGSVEYIRKDLLLEWAKENQEKCFSIVEYDLWQEVIDKLNSL
jgi:hypothetical protein